MNNRYINYWGDHHDPIKQKLNKQIKEWLDKNIIQPSYSDYASPIILVKKKDGSDRSCIGYRELNRKIVKERY